ncbi:hypothetical protein THMIRHAS_13840 [Thiosulfatimonas sediminis]|uniref:DNA alkylation repair protein n=1 Tax=Thiosulfatimonas sediminis TaxID=2675054 RepID=A0A6F8PV52_9GAMM|nr:DNA alkylation repair protein [Thiosulfatimonas sediminis]BBP46011.1 hypothetical protein THMIRHAS_13840 [Thiosulfatimonas sediminis]
MQLNAIEQHLYSLADEKVAQQTARFFKTNTGGYAANDRFLGIPVPKLRQQIRVASALELDDIAALLASQWHEIRLFAVLLLVQRFANGDESLRTKIYQFYVQNSCQINSWDLVDSSAHKIVGVYLLKRDRAILYQLAKQDCLWQRRIAMVSCWSFIGQHDYNDALNIAQYLLGDREDLLHKAVGWMLREVGKGDLNRLLEFIEAHSNAMSRTTLRYALEKVAEPLRTELLQRDPKRIRKF